MGTQEVKFKLTLPEDIPQNIIEIAKTNLINALYEWVKEDEAKKVFNEAEKGITDKLDIVKANLPPEHLLKSPEDKIITPPNGKISH